MAAPPECASAALRLALAVVAERRASAACEDARRAWHARPTEATATAYTAAVRALHDAMKAERLRRLDVWAAWGDDDG